MVVEFLIKSGKTNAEIQNLLQAMYGNATMSRTTLYEWIGCFRVGRNSVDKNPCGSKPRTACTNKNVALVRSTISANCQKTLRDVASNIGISHKTVRSIFRKNLNLRKVSPRMVSRVLMEDQKNERIWICCDWMVANEEEGIFSCVIAGDESWIFEYDLVKKRVVWLAPNEPRMKKARKSKSQIKFMVTIFFNCRGIILIEWMETGFHDHWAVVYWHNEVVMGAHMEETPSLWRDNSWILHHDNAPTHRSFVVAQFLAKNRTTVLEHPPYLPDLAPCDFFLFDKVKDSMRGSHLGSVEAVKEKTGKNLCKFHWNFGNFCKDRR